MNIFHDTATILHIINVALFVYLVIIELPQNANFFIKHSIIGEKQRKAIYLDDPNIIRSLFHTEFVLYETLRKYPLSEIDAYKDDMQITFDMIAYGGRAGANLRNAVSYDTWLKSNSIKPNSKFHCPYNALSKIISDEILYKFAIQNDNLKLSICVRNKPFLTIEKYLWYTYESIEQEKNIEIKLKYNDKVAGKAIFTETVEFKIKNDNLPELDDERKNTVYVTELIKMFERLSDDYDEYVLQEKIHKTALKEFFFNNQSIWKKDV